MMGKPWTEGRSGEQREGEALRRKRLTQPRPHMVPSQTWQRELPNLCPFALCPLPILLGVLRSPEVGD